MNRIENLSSNARSSHTTQASSRTPPRPTDFDPRSPSYDRSPLSAEQSAAALAAASLQSAAVAQDPRSPCEVTRRTPLPSGKKPQPSKLSTSTLSKSLSTSSCELDGINDSSIELDSPTKIRCDSIFAAEDEESEHYMSFDAEDQGLEEQNTSIVDVTILDSSLILRESGSQAFDAELPSVAPAQGDGCTSTVVQSEEPSPQQQQQLPALYFSLEYQGKHFSSEELSSSNDDLATPLSDSKSTFFSCESLENFPATTAETTNNSSSSSNSNPTPAAKKVSQMTPLATALGNFLFSPSAEEQTPCPSENSQKSKGLSQSVPASPASPSIPPPRYPTSSVVRKRSTTVIPQKTDEKKSRRFSLDGSGLPRRSPSAKLRLFDARGKDRLRSFDEGAEDQPGESVSVSPADISPRSLTLQTIANLGKENNGGDRPSSSSSSPSLSSKHGSKKTAVTRDRGKRRSLSENFQGSTKSHQ